MMKTRILSILALLLMAVSGAWAQTPTLLTTIEAKGDYDFITGSKTYDGIATVTLSGSIDHYGDVWGWCAINENDDGLISVTAAEGYTITSCKFFTSEGSGEDTESPFEAKLNYLGDRNRYAIVNGQGIGCYGIYKIEVYGYAPTSATKYELTLADGSNEHGTVAFTVGGNAATQAVKNDVVTVSVTPNEGYSAKDVTARAYTSWEAASEILTGGGDNPELVSDINVKKQENGTWSFTMPEANVWIKVTYVADKTELNNAITEAENYYNEIKDSNPDAAAVLLTAINTAKGVQGNADATQTEIESAAQTLTAASNAAKQEVALKRVTLTIPAKNYMTRIDAGKRQIENAVPGVKLYSVKSVTNTEVELTGELSVIAAEMPYFIYNDNDAEVEVSIVVSSEDADNVDYDSDHFKGTLIDKTFTDEDMQAADHYVLTGKDFVWVKDASTLAAGKCWIELIPTLTDNARRLSIVAEGATGINTAKTAADNMDGFVYDLQGRRIVKPTKGVVIINGKKVLIK